MSGPVVLYKWKTYLSATSLCFSMMRGITYPIALVVGIFTVIIIVGVGTQPISSVISADRTSILIVDLHLEECIRQLQLGNAEEALDHCKSADQELDTLLANMTSEN
jgi:hypothetical protein